jgi:antitoxin VapB
MQTAKLFQNGQSQAVRLPKEFRFEGREVFIKKVGGVIVLLPTHSPWDSFIESFGKFSDDFMSDRAQPKQQHQDREDIFL